MGTVDARPGSRDRPVVKVLVVEDAPEFRRLIAGALEQEGFHVESVADGERAVEDARRIGPDVIVLDLGLPGIDGLEACRQIRSFSDAWIIMLTARHEEVDKVVGLSVGADDYLTKPFSSRELVARIRAVLRRRDRPASEKTTRQVGDLVIDTAAREVTLRGEKVDLTRLEFDVLDVLSTDPGVVFSRVRLLDRLWGPGWHVDDHV